jgi:hypothetical protein
MKKTNIYTGFTILVAIACLLTFLLNTINGRFHLCDFKVYYSAAINLINSGPVYMISFDSGSGFYKYSPATLFFFLPYTFFNFETAAIIHFLILGVAFWYTFIVIRKLIRDYFLGDNVKHEAWLIAVSFGCILIYFAREMEVGNINIILLMVCCFTIRSFLASKLVQGGILLGIMILAKPYLLILFLPMVLRKKWRALGWATLTVAAGLLLPFIFPGPQRSFELYNGWINTMLTHGESFPGMTSLDYFVRFLLPGWPRWGDFVIFSGVISLCILFIIKNLRSESLRGEQTDRITNMNFTFEWFLLLALLPNLIKTDWVLMLFSAPLITFMVFYIASKKQYGWIPILIVLLFFYGANSDDLLGRELSHSIMQSGLMGLSNFLLVIVSLFMFIKLKKETA